MKFVISHPEHAGQRLDRALATRWPELSRSRLQSLIKDGHVTLNGQPAKARHLLRQGDLIELELPEPQSPELIPEAIPLSILYEDEQLLVLDKASGMPVHPGAGHTQGTLVHALLAHCRQLSKIGGEERPGIVHRLDKATSGCLVVAKDDAAHQALSHQFSERLVTKIYLAVVHGRPSPSRGRLENFIGRHPVNRQKMAVVDPSHGKPAVTDYEALTTVGDATLVRCHLHTGRTHQIRVHLHKLGHPLLGDDIYARKRHSSHAPARLLLHAATLGFTHPETGEMLTFHAPVPAEFAPWLDPSHPPV